ncbi:DUF2767 family protein [Pectobacterium versatile]|uniref:DUF2767 family protein n=1 Tax=Pectobacterium versatile TaxID=2488639 RepID=UPI00382B44AC
MVSRSMSDRRCMVFAMIAEGYESKNMAITDVIRAEQVKGLVGRRSVAIHEAGSEASDRAGKRR